MSEARRVQGGLLLVCKRCWDLHTACLFKRREEWPVRAGSEGYAPVSPGDYTMRNELLDYPAEIYSTSSRIPASRRIFAMVVSCSLARGQFSVDVSRNPPWIDTKPLFAYNPSHRNWKSILLSRKSTFFGSEYAPWGLGSGLRGIFQFGSRYYQIWFCDWNLHRVWQRFVQI